MSWARIDDSMPDHPKLARLGTLRPLAGWLHVCGICYAARYLTDGFIPAGQVAALTRFDHVGYETGGVPGMFSVGEDAEPHALAEALVEVGMWHHVRGGYSIHNYLEYNPSRAEVIKKREQNQARVNGFRQRNAARNALPDASPTPTPTPKDIKPRARARGGARENASTNRPTRSAPEDPPVPLSGSLAEFMATVRRAAATPAPGSIARRGDDEAL